MRAVTLIWLAGWMRVETLDIETILRHNHYMAMLPASNTGRPLADTQHPTPFRLTARDAWDKLGLVLSISLTWAFTLALALSLEKLAARSLAVPAQLLLLLLFAMALLPALLAGAFHAAHLVALRDEVTYGDFWRGAMALYRPALGLTACNLLVGIGLCVNIGFYRSFASPAGGAAMLVCLYLLLFWGMMAVYHFPLLIAQEAGVFDEPEHRARRGTVAVLRRAFFLTLGRPFTALGLLAVSLLITIIFSLTGVLFALLWPGVMALLTTHATRALLVRFGVLPPPPPIGEIVPDEKFRVRSK